MSPSRGELTRLIAFGPPVAALIALESRIAAWWPLRFPRGPAEFERNPCRLFDLLTVSSYGLLAPIADPSRAILVTQSRADRLASEPDKNRMTAGFDLTIEEDGARRTVRVLTKFQSGRGMPLYMQAIRAVAEYHFAREIEFYRRLAPVVPVAVPRPLFADALTLINRVCLVLERLDGDTMADWQGCPLPAMQKLLGSAARLNGAFAGRVSASTVAWIPARAGLDFASFVDGFIAKREAWYRRIWTALRAYFQLRPVTLVHGDCRPGNMLFRDEDVVMCDWEAVNVAPLLWDFTYCTIVGLRPDDRRAWLERLLLEFLDSLRQQNVDRRELDVSRAVLDVQLLAIVLAYTSLVVFDHGLWSGHGNTQEDVSAWARRVLDAGGGGDAGTIATALGVPAEDVRRLQEYLLGRMHDQ
jgi:Phosphotransferase enzyme family